MDIGKALEIIEAIVILIGMVLILLHPIIEIIQNLKFQKRIHELERKLRDKTK